MEGAGNTALYISFTILTMMSWTVQSNYCGVCRDHTLCKYSGVGARCGDTGAVVRGLYPGDRERILDTHDSLRQLVAAGGEKRGDPGPQPSAANMQRLKWDNELAKIAQRWADQCQFGHDTCRKTKDGSVGQNVAWESCRGDDKSSNWPARIRSWYDEVSMWNEQEVDNYKFKTSTGHYTQVVWALTRLVGCGFMRYKSGGKCQKLYVCNYGPSGNYITRAVYARGTPRSRCRATSVAADRRYPALC